MLIDVHFHLDLMDNMQSLIHEFQTSDVGIIAVGTTPKAFGKEKKFCCGFVPFGEIQELQRECQTVLAYACFSNSVCARDRFIPKVC